MYPLKCFPIDPELEPTTLYHHGMLDICSVFFYFLICVVIHAVIQEYALDVSKNSFIKQTTRPC